MGVDAILIASGAFITAIAGLVASLTLGAKNLAEARATRGAAEHTSRQVSPNHGSSLADALRRVEARQVEHSKSIGGIRDDMRVLREEKVDEHDDLRRRIRTIEEKREP